MGSRRYHDKEKLEKDIDAEIKWQELIALKKKKMLGLKTKTLKVHLVSIFSKQISTYQKLVSHNFVSICPNLAKKSHGDSVLRLRLNVGPQFRSNYVCGTLWRRRNTITNTWY